MTQPTPPVFIDNKDEIDLADILRKLWDVRGLIAAVALFCVLAALSFHLLKATFHVPNAVDYSLSLNFLKDKNQYPNGSAFHPLDIIAPSVLDSVAQEYALSQAQLAKATSIKSGNSLLAQSEEKLAALLANAKTAEDIKAATTQTLDELRAKTRSQVVVTVDLSALGLNGEQGAKLLQAVVHTWAQQAIERGLMNVDISYPVGGYQALDANNLLANYEGVDKYARSLNVALTALAKLPGSQSLAVEGQSLSDVQRKLTLIDATDISPLRSLAYSNSAALAKHDAEAALRLSSRQRLLELEHTRLTKLIASYDASLKQLAQNDRADTGAKQGAANSQISGGQYDQSFLTSLLDLGNKLSSVEVRDELFKKRTKTIENMLDLEKEMAIVSGGNTNKESEKANALLESALAGVITHVNELQQQVVALVSAYRAQTLGSDSRLYSADAAPQVRGAGIQIGKKAGLITAMALVLGLMLGAMLAIMRGALKAGR